MFFNNGNDVLMDRLHAVYESTLTIFAVFIYSLRQDAVSVSHTVNAFDACIVISPSQNKQLATLLAVSDTGEGQDITGSQRMTCATFKHKRNVSKAVNDKPHENGSCLGSVHYPSPLHLVELHLPLWMVMLSICSIADLPHDE